MSSGKDVKALTCRFAEITIKEGAVKHRVLQDEVLMLVPKEKMIYITQGGNYTVKFKDIVNWDIQFDKLEINTTKKQVIVRRPISVPEESFTSYETFRQTLQGILERKVSPTKPHTTQQFLQSSPRKALGARQRGAFGKATSRRRVTPQTNTERVFDDIFSDDEERTREKQQDSLREHLVKQSAREVETTSDNESVPPALHSRRNRLQKLGKKSFLDDSSDSDTEDVLVTTPIAAQRLVSPSRTTTQKKQTTEQVPKQPSIATFFSVQTAKPQSFDPSYVASPKRNVTSHGARLVRSAKRSQLSSNTSWVMRSPARTHSPARARALHLYGTPTPKWENEDPIRDFDDESVKEAHPPVLSPRKRVRHLDSFKKVEASTTVAPLLVTEDTPVLQRDPFRGLRNLGNTCYMNSSLQVICALPHFMDELRHHDEDGPLTKSLIETYRQLQDQSEESPVIPRSVKDAMDYKTNKFEGYEQRDAHEFLNDVIDNLHEELVVKGGTPFPTDDFRLDVQVCLKCTACGYRRTKDEMYRNLSIDITKEAQGGSFQASVDKSLQHFFQGTEVELKCEKCEEGNAATQTIRIINRPKILLLHLKRFIFMEKPTINGVENAPSNSQDPVAPTYIMKKNKDPVELTENLDIGDFLLEGIEMSSAYSLRGVIHHIGLRPSSGHYTADTIRRCKKEATEQDPDPGDELEDRWVTFDDSRSAKVTWERVAKKKTSAYLVMYVLKDYIQ